MSTNDALHERLVHHIYAMVDDEKQWPELLTTLDAYFADSQQPASGNRHVSALLPHLERANLLLDRIAELQLQSSQTERMLDRIPMGIMLVSPQEQVVSINARAGSLLEHIGAKRENGRLQFKHPGQQRSFGQALSRVARGEERGAALNLDDLCLWISPHGTAGVSQLAVYLGHRTCRHDIRIDQLVKNYALTEKEAQLTARLCDGHASLEEAAEALGISIATARSHLKHVFAKTGAQRQADLVKMVLVDPILTLQVSELPEKMQSATTRDTQLIRLPSGRTLSYAEYGDPRGRPVLFCHALTGCRLLVPQEHRLLQRHKLRLIVPDRAGYGLSTPVQRNNMNQWLKDMQQFLALLDIRSCSVLGHSAGGAYAMQLAVAHPNMVEQLVLVGSIAPLSKETDSAHLLPIHRLILHLARSNPVAARSFIRLSMRALLKNPVYYFGLINEDVSRQDVQTLQDEAMKPLLAESLREVTRQGYRQMINELMHLVTRWRLDPAEINCPVTIWHGTHDSLTPPDLMQLFHERLSRPHAIRWVDDAGFFLPFHHWAKIVKSLARPAGLFILVRMLGEFAPALADAVIF